MRDRKDGGELFSCVLEGRSTLISKLPTSTKEMKSFLQRPRNYRRQQSHCEVLKPYLFLLLNDVLEREKGRGDLCTQPEERLEIVNFSCRLPVMRRLRDVQGSKISR